MLNPIIPYKIKGVIWYQGETNTEQGGPKYEQYKELMPKMIMDLRKYFLANVSRCSEKMMWFLRLQQAENQKIC